MDYYSQLSRYLDRRVCIDLIGRCTLWGKLASVADDHLRLVDTVIQGELEGHSWFDQIQYANDDEGGGLRNSETIIRVETVLHVTCVDDAGPRTVTETPKLSVLTDESAETSGNRLRKSQSELAASLKRLNAGLRKEPDDFSRQDDEVCVTNDRIEIRIGIDLIPLADFKRGGDLMDRVRSARKQIATETGVILPTVHVRDRSQIGSSEYQFLVNGHIVASGEIRMDAYFAFNLDTAADAIKGVETLDPVHGLKARWIARDQAEPARSRGATVCEPAAVLQTHFTHAMKGRLHDIVSFQDVLELLQELRESHFESIDKVVPQKVPLEVLHRVIRRLLEEGVSIKNLYQIIESVAYHIDQVADHEELLQRLRVDIGRDICAPVIDENNQFHAVVLEQELEDDIAEFTGRIPEAAKPEAIASLIESIAPTQDSIVIVVHRSDIRRELFLAISALRPDITVIAKREIPKDVILVPQLRESAKKISQALPPR